MVEIKLMESLKDYIRVVLISFHKPQLQMLTIVHLDHQVEFQYLLDIIPLVVQTSPVIAKLLAIVDSFAKMECELLAQLANSIQMFNQVAKELVLIAQLDTIAMQDQILQLKFLAHLHLIHIQLLGTVLQVPDSDMKFRTAISHFLYQYLHIIEKVLPYALKISFASMELEDLELLGNQMHALMDLVPFL